MAIIKGTEFKASDGNKYKFLGKQWALVDPKTGKTTRMASTKITLELERLAAANHMITPSTSVFDTLLLRGIRSGEVPARTQAARDWFRNTAKGTTISRHEILAEKTRFVNKVEPGKMYMFQYYAKLRNKLPYWDAFPLIFPIEKYEDGFLGINFHYLPYDLRAKLMDALYKISSDKRYDEKTKLIANYRLLKGASQYKYFIPTIHRYLSEQVQSKFIEVASSEWDVALFLQVQNWKGSSQDKIWRDSRNKI